MVTQSDFLTSKYAVFFTFAATTAMNGNGYLAVYICGIYIGNACIPGKRSVSKFMDVKEAQEFASQKIKDYNAFNAVHVKYIEDLAKDNYRRIKCYNYILIKNKIISIIIIWIIYRFISI